MVHIFGVPLFLAGIVGLFKLLMGPRGNTKMMSRQPCQTLRLDRTKRRIYSAAEFVPF